MARIDINEDVREAEEVIQQAMTGSVPTVEKEEEQLE
jgi:hypothetical protein